MATPPKDPDIKVNVVSAPSDIREYGGPRDPERFRSRLDELSSAITWFRDSFQQHLESMSAPATARNWKMDNVELTVSVDLEAEAGVVFARAKSSAGFELKIAWSRSDDN